ncbi:MAG: patatin-like phospholipase RssA [Burkholderiaceae bacterium]|nr:patatin-like phospholipase RssA [Burkholderiaceae bacterium]MCD8516667.1 patatin-like phospholipase RssA [Burkholderiaceae bacterium]MCD8536314.1 patatin-like phospholipase RssA [Burkholderiaceae bacterium]MCD8564448.1 patatin-like phospholipase RssA [Burkholderiaceae bacterium]
MSLTSKPVLALALGGGAARGWAHVGVIRALEQRGIRPDIVCGTSIGALVGAAYASGELDRFEQWIKRLTVVDIVTFMDFSLNGGLIKGEKLMGFFEKTFVDRPIENLRLPFAAVACDLHSGAEVWLRDGSTADAVRASLALPGLLTPVHYRGKTLVDGGLVNPVPVSLARAMGSDLVIAVDLNADLIGRHLKEHETDSSSSDDKQRAVPVSDDDNSSGWIEHVQQQLQKRMPLKWPAWGDKDTPPVPSLFDVVASSINIMQVRITRSRMAGEPPDLIIAPKLADLGLMDFHRAEIAIEEGRLAVERAVDQLDELL